MMLYVLFFIQNRKFIKKKIVYFCFYCEVFCCARLIRQNENILFIEHHFVVYLKISYWNSKHIFSNNFHIQCENFDKLFHSFLVHTQQQTNVQNDAKNRNKILSQNKEIRCFSIWSHFWMMIFYLLALQQD